MVILTKARRLAQRAFTLHFFARFCQTSEALRETKSIKEDQFGSDRFVVLAGLKDGVTIAIVTRALIVRLWGSSRSMVELSGELIDGCIECRAAGRSA
jgi:hypothetical protein